MQTFRELDRHLDPVPARVAQALAAIDYGRGRQDLHREQNPALLKTLVDVARVQSTEASNAIESITAPHERVERLVLEKTTPQNRSEAEIAGYRAVLDTIHASHASIPFKRSVIEQFHRDIYQYTATPGGRFKSGPNDVKEFHPDGRVVVRFEPVSVGDTPFAMDELEEAFTSAWAASDHHRLLLIGAWVFDFLMIHPFQDGNGRMSRLLTLLLLYHAGYEVGRFISLEKLINDSRETYYESLVASTTGWHDGQHDIWPWMGYFLGTIVAAYKAFEERVGAVSNAKGAKAELVRAFIRSSVSDVFTFDDVRRASPGVSDVYIKKILAELKQAHAVEPLGKGPGARWRRLNADI